MGPKLAYEAESPIGTAMKHVTEPIRSPREAKPSVPEPLAALTMKLLAKDPEDRYASAPALLDDLKRVRPGLPPVVADAQETEKMTVRLPPLPPSPQDERTKRTVVQPPVAAPLGAPGRDGRRRGRLFFSTLFALLVGTILLGTLIWAFTRSADYQPGAEDAQDRRVQVPDLIYASTAETNLAAAGLKLGRQDEAPSDTVPVGVVSEQDPVEGTEVEEGTAVDIVVSTGPRQAPADDEKQREKQRQEEEKQRERQQQEEEKRRERGE